MPENLIKKRSRTDGALLYHWDQTKCSNELISHSVALRHSSVTPATPYWIRLCDDFVTM